MSLEIILICLSSFLFGCHFTIWLTNLIEKRKISKEISKKNEKFNNILSNLKSSPIAVTFKSRVNSIAYFMTNLETEGDVDIIYLIDKSDIVIFKDEVCISSSKDVNSETIEEIISLLNRHFSNDINEVVNVMGVLLSKSEFERMSGLNVNDIKNSLGLSEQPSEIDKIYEENQLKFDIDEILDRINLVGIKNLTRAELEFLKNYSKDE